MKIVTEFFKKHWKKILFVMFLGIFVLLFKGIYKLVNRDGDSD